jgi:putative copper export protein
MIAALFVRLWTQTAAAFGPNDAWLLDNLRLMALESRWGAGWRPQLLAAMALLITTLLLSIRRAGWIAYDVCAVGVVLAMPLLGHAAGNIGRQGMHGAHNLAASAWLGTLGVIVLREWIQRRSPFSSSAQSALVHRFSPVALVSTAIVAVSGMFATWLYVGTWEAMWTTEYGQILSFKLLGVAIIAVCGWTNWRAVRAGAAPRVLLMTIEWIAALVVLGLTGVLTEIEHP